jgi:glycerol-3-phosphate dehydrogenase
MKHEGNDIYMHDVIIIGGGVIGCAVARELSRWTLDIILLEKTDDICMGASKANTAIIHAGHHAESGTLKAKFNVTGNAMFDRISEELDVPFRRNGSLVVAFEGDDLSGLEELKERGKTNGVPDLSIVDRDELIKLEPNIGKAAVAALVTPTGGIVCPFRLTIALAENAADNGVRFIMNAGVQNIHPVKDGWEVVTEDGKKYKTKTIVNCAGPESGLLNNLVSATKIDILPRRGEYYLMDQSFKGVLSRTIFQMPSDKGKGIVVVETVDGNMLLGPNAEELDPETGLHDTRTTADGLKEVYDSSLLSWDDIPRSRFITNFSGVRARSKTDDFIIGEVVDAPGFFNAAGIESPGLTSAPAIGDFLAKQVASKLHAAPKSDFDPKRAAIKAFKECSPDERCELIEGDPAYGRIVCRCETVTESEVRQAIRRPVGARNLDALKRRVRTGAGRCQSGFCCPRALEILCEELGKKPTEITKFGGASQLLKGRIGGKKQR